MLGRGPLETLGSFTVSQSLETYATFYPISPIPQYLIKQQNEKLV